MKKYIAYYRVSTKKQGESGLGLDAQKAIVHHFLKDFELVAEYVEVRSGGSLEGRVELRAAIDHAKRENASLIVAKADRLSRNVVDALTIFDELNENVKCCDMPAETSRFMLTMIFAFAEHERLLISLRTKAALDAKKKNENREKINGASFHDIEKENYSYNPSVAGARSAEIKKANISLKQRNMILISKELRKKGESMQKIAITLQNYGYKTENQKDITPTHVFRYLKR
jgi:DNA invertase Pin-like site-specific DNA recombinase